MYAVIEAGGRQYKMAQGQKLRVEKLDLAEGAEVTFDKVLLLSDGETTKVGQPLVDGASVKAKVLVQARGPKIHILKFKRRKHHMKRAGHRQAYTEVEVTAIQS